MADTSELTVPEEPRGILIIAGSTFALTEFRLEIDEHGEIHANMRPQIGWEMWPLWMRVAIDHEELARQARARLVIATDDLEREAALGDETRAGMVTTSASAFALEAMATSVITRASLHGVGRNTSAGKRVAEVLRQAFAVQPAAADSWRKAVIEVFRLRNWAVHPDSGITDPLEHPAIHPLVPRPAHVYRLENAEACLNIALSTVDVLPRRPRPGRGKSFAEGIKAWPGFADELIAHRTMLQEPPAPE